MRCMNAGVVALAHLSSEDRDGSPRLPVYAFGRNLIAEESQRSLSMIRKAIASGIHLWEPVQMVAYVVSRRDSVKPDGRPTQDIAHDILSTINRGQQLDGAPSSEKCLVHHIADQDAEALGRRELYGYGVRHIAEIGGCSLSVVEHALAMGAQLWDPVEAVAFALAARFDPKLADEVLEVLGRKPHYEIAEPTSLELLRAWIVTGKAGLVTLMINVCAPEFVNAIKSEPDSIDGIGFRLGISSVLGSLPPEVRSQIRSVLRAQPGVRCILDPSERFYVLKSSGGTGRPAPMVKSSACSGRERSLS